MCDLTPLKLLKCGLMNACVCLSFVQWLKAATSAITSSLTSNLVVVRSPMDCAQVLIPILAARWRSLPLPFYKRFLKRRLDSRVLLRIPISPFTSVISSLIRKPRWIYQLHILQSCMLRYKVPSRPTPVLTNYPSRCPYTLTALPTPRSAHSIVDLYPLPCPLWGCHIRLHDQS